MTINTLNKMKKSLVIALILMAFAENALAQNTYFKVFYSQGNAFIISGKQKKAAQRNMLIAEGQVLKLDKNSSVILIATNGTALPVSVAAAYPFKNLLSLMDENSRSLTSRYFTYVVQEMTEAHEKPEDKLTGGVSRSEKLMHLPWDSCLVIQNGIRFSWIHGTSSELLFLTIGEKNGRNVFSKPLRDTTYYYETRPGKTDQTFEWSVGYEPEYTANIVTRAFTIASTATGEHLKKELAELETSMNLEPEYNELVRLNFYERNHLFIEEYNALNEALAKFPQSILIHDYFTLFSKKQ